MNSKKTNYLITILNIIAVITVYLFLFSIEYFRTGVIMELEFLVLYSDEILVAFIEIIGVLNIIATMQNKKNKKLCFWYLVFGLLYVISGLTKIIDEYIFEEFCRILIGICSIGFALVNIILIKKRKVKIIQIISYIISIIIGICIILDVFIIFWDIIAIVMQLIYVHSQEKNVEESKSRKRTNLILYYIVQLSLSVVFFVVLITSLITNLVFILKWKKELSNLYEKINYRFYSEITLIPVEKDGKYGFIDKNGVERIPCEYNNVSFFNEIYVNEATSYVALAQKDNKYYLLSKTNETILIEGFLDSLINKIAEGINENIILTLKESKPSFLQVYFQIVLAKNVDYIKRQEGIYLNSNDNYIMLSHDDSDTFKYKTKKYTMEIDKAEIDDYENDDSNTLEKVTIKKLNGETDSSMVELVEFEKYDPELAIFSNGFIKIKNEDCTKEGWYDNEGNKTFVPEKYTIDDIMNNKIFLVEENKNDIGNYSYIICDLSGKELLRSSMIFLYDNYILMNNKDNKTVLMDYNLNIITDEYDKIIPSLGVDLNFGNQTKR